ncbi:MAG: DNA-binding protein [Oscillospiraceae bacterium]|nr:DNA-binding protein [Oscillospiraceae bacterium]
MAKNLDYAMLLDFYGDLLTEKQRDIMQLYYFEDLSLSEIAENENISRQGVHDAIKHAEQYLDEFEEKIGLFRKTTTFRELVAGIKQCTAEYTEKYKYQKSISDYSDRIIRIIEKGEELFR